MNLTASSLWRAELCAASAVLPHTKQVYADAEAGTREHAAMEANPPENGIPEVAFVYNVLSERAREVGRSIGRNYGELEEGDIPGTADLVTLVDADLVKVTDFKTGHGHLVTPPSENLQLQHNLLCAMLTNRRWYGRAEIVFTRTGEAPDHLYDVFDLPAIKARLRRIWESCDEAEKYARTEMNQAAWADRFVHLDREKQCWRCPAKQACPAWRK